VDAAVRLQCTMVVKDDIRLRDVFAYFLANGADTAILFRTFCEKLEMGLEGETGEV